MSCGRLTPSKHGECIYCSTSLHHRLARKQKGPGFEEPRVLGGGTPRFTKQSDDRTHYLVVDTRDPVALVPGRLFVIGRDPRASLVVHSPEVSRQHAEVDWDDHDPPRPVLCEVRSSNGTYLNGTQITRDSPQPLRSGDEIRLGEFQVDYLHVTDRELEQELQERGHNETRRFSQQQLTNLQGPLGFPAAIQLPHGSSPPAGDPLKEVVAAMGEGLDHGPIPPEGDLATTSGGTLLRKLHKDGASGILLVFDGQTRGELILGQGRCTRAAFGQLSGRSALEKVAALNSGRYHFNDLKAPTSQRLPRPPRKQSPPTPLRPAQRSFTPQQPVFSRVTAPLRVDALRVAAESSVPLEGNLTQLPGGQLLQMIERERLTGILTIIDGSNSGQLRFSSGRCDDAHLAGHVDENAVGYLSRLVRGAYRFRVHGAARPTAQRPSGPSPLRAPRSGGWDVAHRVVPLKRPSGPIKRPALRPPSGRHSRRAVGHVGQQPDALKQTPSAPRRRPPPLPRRPPQFP